MAEDAPQQRDSKHPAFMNKPTSLAGPSDDNSGDIWPRPSRYRSQVREQNRHLSRYRNRSGSGSENSVRSDTGTGIGTNTNLMDGENRAFASSEGDRPKTSDGTRRNGESRRGHIKRSLSSSSSFELKEGTSPIIRDMFERAEKEEIAKMTPAPERVAPVDYESLEPSEGSPTPATRDRRQINRGTSDIKKLVVERNFQDGSEKPLTQYERDLAYRERLLANPNPVFVQNNWRATKPRKTLTEQIIATGTNEEKWKRLENEPEPPLNIPRSWGTKARARPGWVQRILSPDPSLEIKNEIESIHEDYQQLEADIPLPSVELGSEPTPPTSRPTSAQPNKEFLEENSYLQPWDADVDFTGESLLTSSPMLKIKPSRLNQISEREARNLNPRYAAMNRLEEITERNSEEPVPYAHGSVRDDTQKEPAPDVHGQERNAHGYMKDETKDLLRELSRVLAPKTRRTVIDEHGEPVEESAKERTGKQVQKSAEKPAEEVVEYKPERSPSVERILEKARARQREKSASRSEAWMRAVAQGEARQERRNRPISIGKLSETSTEKLVEKPEAKQVEKQEDASQKGKGLDGEVENKRRSRASSPPKSDVDPEERITAEAKLFELRDDKSEKNSNRAASRSPSPSDNGKNDETPRPKADPLSLPTPKVTGAYIDTPAPSSRKLVSQRSVSPTYEMVDPVDISSTHDTRVTRIITTQQKEPPRLINTAERASAAEDLRRIKLEANIEDSTLDDLDLLLENEAAVKAELMETNRPIVDLEYDDRGLPLSQAEKERRIERVILERMALRLKNTSSSIRDARQGIERLEQEVSTAPILQATASNDADTQYVNINIKMKVPRLYTVHTPPASSKGQNAGWFANRNWRFTWFGLFVFIFSIWYLAETAMCEAFCHPEYSSKNTWKPSDPFFPWAIPTKLDQWTGEVVSGTIKGIETTVMDWYDPDRFKRPVHPKNRYLGANDWWVGQSGPAPMYRAPEKAGSIYDDEVYDG